MLNSAKQEVIIYTRFSPRRNAEECESCEHQEAECRRYADQRLWEVKTVWSDEAVSGASENRPGLFGAMEELSKGDILLIYKPDRLARDVYLTELFRRSVTKQGAKIVCVSGDVEGEGPEVTMVRQIIASVAEYERKLIAVRTKAAMLFRQSRGEIMGRFPPYGWEYRHDQTTGTKFMIRNEAELSAVQLIAEKTEEGWKMSEITAKLNEGFMRNIARSDNGWNQKTVTKISNHPMLKQLLDASIH